MIPRVFRARLKPGRRAAYEALIRDHARPLMRKAQGNVAIHLGPPRPDQPDARAAAGPARSQAAHQSIRVRSR